MSDTEQLELSYRNVGATRSTDLSRSAPDACRPMVRRARIGSVRDAFEAAGELVLRWGAQRRSRFAYGTLPGHPESGEESFVVEYFEDESVWIEIRAFSLLSSGFYRLGYPVLRLSQDFYTRRYLRALRA